MAKKKSNKNNDADVTNEKISINFEVLSIFSKIDNSAIVFPNSKSLVHYSKAGDVILRYNSGPLFSTEFVAQDLSQFIEAFKIFDDAYTFEFVDNSIKFKSQTSKKTFKYTLGGKDVFDDLMNDLDQPIEHIDKYVESLGQNDPMFSFEIDEKLIKELHNISSKMQLRDLCVTFKKGKKKDKLTLKLLNIDVPGGNESEIEIPLIDNTYETDFYFYINITNILPDMVWKCFVIDGYEDLYLKSNDEKYDMCISHLDLLTDDFDELNDDLYDID